MELHSLNKVIVNRSEQAGNLLQNEDGYRPIIAARTIQNLKQSLQTKAKQGNVEVAGIVCGTPPARSLATFSGLGSTLRSPPQQHLPLRASTLPLFSPLSCPASPAVAAVHLATVGSQLLKLCSRRYDVTRIT